ncbi:hypothetical protein CUP99_20985 [Salmonella enterica subsp. houtenae serovar 53:z4,z23:-]|nr:hypothetical protein [Salmonella enterica subsp. houtenae serovar 53:z4,z23:-]
MKIEYHNENFFNEFIIKINENRRKTMTNSGFTEYSKDLKKNDFIDHKKLAVLLNQKKMIISLQ